MTHSTNNPPEWPQCGEPYATSLKQFAQKWFDGEMSDGDLALEIIELQQKVIYTEREAREDGLRVPSSLGQARKEISVLAQTLAEHHATEWHRPSTKEEWQIAFKVVLDDSRESGSYHRGH